MEAKNENTTLHPLYTESLHRIEKAQKLVKNVDRDLGELKQMIPKSHWGSIYTQADPDAIDDLAAKLVMNINLAETELQYAIRDSVPDHVVPPWYRGLLMTSSDGYDVLSDESGLYIKTPMAPISAYRSRAKKRGTTLFAHSRKHYKPIIHRIYRAGTSPAVDRKSVYILHVFRTYPAFRSSPDYDNYDVKDLVDCAMTVCGGDGVNNIAMMIHESTVRTDLDAGTYLAVRPVDYTLTFEEYRDEALEHFRSMHREDG